MPTKRSRKAALPQKTERSSEAPIEIAHANGKVSSSVAPAFELIPTEALLRVADRFQLGRERKKEKAWNALSSNQEALQDKDWVLERISHVVFHALKLRDKVLRETPLEGDDDAAAIAWSGMFLCCATRALAERKAALLLREAVAP